MAHGDFFKILNAAGLVCAHGFGHPPTLQEGETIVFFDTEAEKLADPDVARSDAIDAARTCIGKCKTENRSQAFVLKTFCARAFLRDVPDLNMVGPEHIDPDLYYELHTEYLLTYLITGDTPWKLARAMDARSRAVTDAENARRKIIVESEQLIEEIRIDNE